jgi:hypothetical protein
LLTKWKETIQFIMKVYFCFKEDAMKKALLILTITVFFASTCPAEIIIRADTAGPGSLGHSGTPGDPLFPGEQIYVDILLNHNPHPSVPAYDGYLLSMFGTDIEVTGPGTLGMDSLSWNSGFDVSTYDSIIDNSNYVGAVSLLGIVGEAILVSGFWVECDDFGTIVFDLSLGDLTQYGEYNTWPGPGTGAWEGWIDLTDPQLGDLVLGDLILHTTSIPEPASFVLFALGALALRKKR